MNSFSVPLESGTAYDKWGIILGIVVVVIVMGSILFIYSRERMNNVVYHDKGNFNATITNKTPYKFKIQSPHFSKTLNSGEKYDVVLGMHEVIKAKANPNNKTLEFHTIPTENLDNLYITEDGFGDDSETSTDIPFINNSDKDVHFVLVSSHGQRRFPTPVPANSKVEHIIKVGQTWQVVPHNNTNNVLGELTLHDLPYNLVFDGKSLNFNQ